MFLQVKECGENIHVGMVEIHSLNVSCRTCMVSKMIWYFIVKQAPFNEASHEMVCKIFMLKFLYAFTYVLVHDNVGHS